MVPLENNVINIFAHSSSEIPFHVLSTQTLEGQKIKELLAQDEEFNRRQDLKTNQVTIIETLMAAITSSRKKRQDTNMVTLVQQAQNTYSLRPKISDVYTSLMGRREFILARSCIWYSNSNRIGRCVEASQLGNFSKNCRSTLAKGADFPLTNGILAPNLQLDGRLAQAKNIPIHHAFNQKHQHGGINKSSSA